MSNARQAVRVGRRFRIAGVALACVMATACGSTVAGSGTGGQVPGTTGTALGDAASQGLEVPNTLSGPGNVPGAAPNGAAVGGTASSDGGSTGSSGSTGSGGTTVTGTGGAPTSVSSGTGPGSTSGPPEPATFKIGLQYTSNGAAAVNAVSGGSFDGDSRQETDAVIAWINKNGGVAGRPAAPVYNDIDATAAPATQSETACALWTQDERVSLAIPTSAVDDRDLMRECLKRAGVPALMGYVSSRTLSSSFKNSPLWFENGSLSVNDYAQTYVRGLAKQGFFEGGKVGVVYYDRPPFSTALESDLLPALRAVGVTDAEAFGASIDGASTLGTGSNEMSSAVLAFRSRGVDRVLFFEPWIGYFAFLNNAKSQNYRPAYGLSSQQGPQLAMELGFVPADQLENARIVSWNPMTDVRDYEKFTGPKRSLCLQIFEEAGIPLGADQTKSWQQLLGCENLLLVQDAYRTAPPKLSPQDFARGAESLGAGVQFATRPGGSFAPDKHWATSKYWAGRFDSAQGSFVYEGPPQDVF